MYPPPNLPSLSVATHGVPIFGKFKTSLKGSWGGEGKYAPMYLPTSLPSLSRLLRGNIVATGRVFGVPKSVDKCE